MTRLDLIPIVELNLRPKVPNLVIINSLFITKVDLPNFPCQSPTFCLNFNRRQLRQIARKSSSNDTKITINQSPIFDKYTNSTPPLSTINSQPTTLSSVNTCLLHSLTHTTISHQQQFHLSTQFLHSNKHLIAKAQPNFHQMPCSRFIFPSFDMVFASKPHHSTRPQTIPVWL